MINEYKKRKREKDERENQINSPVIREDIAISYGYTLELTASAWHRSRNFESPE